MPRRTTSGIAIAALLLAVALATPAFGVSSALVQNVDTSQYPKIVLTLVVSPDAVSSAGEVPQVRVTENGKTLAEVNVSSLELERQPIDVVLLMDASGSMKGQPLADAKLAARRFVEEMAPSDRIAVVAFSSEPRVVQDFTSDRAALFGAIDSLGASGETALYDGLVQAASVIAPSTAAERYIVALSDGGDTMSLNPADNAATAVANAKAPVYAVALESPEYNPRTLETIAGVSGGRMITVGTSGGLVDVYQSLAQEMQLRYRVECVGSRPNTPELDLQLTVGSGNSPATTELTVANPRFTSSVDKATTLRVGKPSALALSSSLLTMFGATALLVVALALIFRKDKAALEQLRYYDQLRGRAAPEDLDDDSARANLLSTLGTLAERRGFTGLVQRWLDSAGIVLRANEYIMFHVGGTIVTGVLAAMLSQGSLGWATFAVLLAVVLPLLFLRLKAAKRLHDFNEQLPAILDLIAGSLRSGWGIQQSLDLVVKEVGDPASTEFARTQAEARLGLALEQALQRMADRIGSEDLRWVVTAIAIQREVGGNLAEVLNNVSKTIRGRAELRRQVSALTAEGRVSLVFLSIMPFLVFGGLFVVNRPYMLLAVKAPLGIAAFALGGTLLLVGIYWLSRVMKIEV